ncbi:DNA ligase 1 isoform X1 [Capsicum annuum]|uniref:DNA ligase 1 isoform X1 n=1 Tax=Capsicum annuum TaxID=4072 RepID=UPI001FB0B05C|nr:DNA ligase 1 isoform X1 [Capsicum annuum]
MNDTGTGNRKEGLITYVRKKRSPTLRRPRTENSIFPESLSDKDRRVSRDEQTDDANAEGRIHDDLKGDNSSKKNKEDGGSSATYKNSRQRDDTNSRLGGNAGDGIANDTKVKRIKLKVGGATHIIQTKNSSDGSSKSAQPSDSSRPRQNLTPQVCSKLKDSPSGSRRISSEDLPGGTSGARKSDKEKKPTKNVFIKQEDKPPKKRKSKKLTRRLILDWLDEDEEDEKIHNSEKLNLGKESTIGGLKVDKSEMLEDVARSGEEVKRIASQGSERTDNEEKEMLSDVAAKQTKKKDKQMKESSETPVETKSGTTQQRALLSGEEVERIASQGSERTDNEKKEMLSDAAAKQTKKKDKQLKESSETPVETKSKTGRTKRALLSGKEVKIITSQGSERTDNEKKEILSDEAAKQTKKKKDKQMKESSETPAETKSEVGRTKRQQALLSGKEVNRITSQGSEHTDYEKKELLSDGGAKRSKKEKQLKESSEKPVETKSEVGRTKQQQALLSGKEVKRTSSQGSENTDHEKKELLPDGEAKQTKKKDSTETPVETKRERALTKRQRALLSGKEAKRISSQGSENTDYEKKELSSDGEASRSKKKEKEMKESSETPVETKREIGLTTRQWALLLKKDSSTSSVDLIEFPSGLPPAPPQKQKQNLSEVELQLKRAKANQKRQMQHEKAARESEAEAIRKIRGQGSSRKKREEKLKKEQEELAQKAAKELPPNTIRTVMGPSGTTVTFSHDIGLPSIFDSKPCSYPPPREKCAGPSCENTYKYRDSKTNVPLCSLKCYKAIHETMQDEKAS